MKFEKLDPYPVTTNSTDVNKVITLFSDDYEVICLHTWCGVSN